MGGQELLGGRIGRIVCVSRVEEDGWKEGRREGGSKAERNGVGREESLREKNRRKKNDLGEWWNNI